MGERKGLKEPLGHSKELLKPIVFGNYQPHFKFFNALVTVGKAHLRESNNHVQINISLC